MGKFPPPLFRLIESSFTAFVSAGFHELIKDLSAYWVRLGAECNRKFLLLHDVSHKNIKLIRILKPHFCMK